MCVLLSTVRYRHGRTGNLNDTIMMKFIPSLRLGVGPAGVSQALALPVLVYCHWHASQSLSRSQHECVPVTYGRL